MDSPAQPTINIGVVFLHPGCNMTCTFCVTENGFSAMRFDQGRALLDEMKRRGIGNVVLGGGEPFTWTPGVVRLAEAAKRGGMTVQVGTNGVALPPGYERLDCIDRYVLPLDAPDARVHDAMRLYSSSHHALILDRLDCLRDAGKPVTISTVVTAENIERLEELGGFLADYVLSGARLHAWHLYQFIPSGRGGGRNAARLRVAPEAYEDACGRMKAMDLGFTIFKRRDMRHSRTVDFFWYVGDRLVVGSEVWGDAAPEDEACDCIAAASMGRLER